MSEVQVMTEKGCSQDEVQAQGAGLRRPWQFITQLMILFRIQFSIIRNSWVWIFVMASIFPLSTLFFLKFFSPGAGVEVIVRIITGNMVFAISLMGVNALAQDLSWQKHRGHFVFYASLPISKLSFVASILLRGFITTFPSVAILCVIGQLVFGITFQYSLGLIPLTLVAMLSTVGFGTVLGFWSPNHQFTNMLAQALLMFISFLTPVMVDASQLPLLLRWVSALFPTTYVAHAYRIIFVEGWTLAVAKDLVILTAFSLASIWLVQKKVSWRFDS